MQNQEDHERTICRQTEVQFLLRGVSGITFGKSFPLIGSMVIGRDNTCDITIPSDEISRNHARIVARPGSILIEDTGSSNGTFVNNLPIERAVVKEGDEIRFDKIRFQVQSFNQLEEFLTEPNSRDTSNHVPSTPPAKKRSGIKIVTISLLLIAISAGAFYFFTQLQA